MAYRAGEVEVLLSVDDRDVARAEKNVKATGDRIEKKPIKPKVDADVADAIAGMDQVEAAAKRIVSEDVVARVDANIERAERNVSRIEANLDYLRSVSTELDVDADIRRAERNLARVQANLDGLQKVRTTLEVEADPSDALDGIDRVEAAAKQLVSRETAIRVNANVATALRAVDDIRAEIDYLQSLSPTVDVTADVAQAEARLAGAEAALRDLNGARATMQVLVDDGGAKQKLQDVADYAEDAGEDGGARGGAGLVGGIIGALATIPIVGAIAGIGETLATTIVDEFEAALQVEVRQDRLQALTGIDEGDAARFARAAAEAYANNFGDSIESNMDITRLALQFDLIDADATTRDTQRVVQGLAGIADVLQEDVGRSATAVSVLLRSGMAASAEDAYDIIAAGAREGLNRNEDLLDTLTEYPVVLRRLGLTGDEMLGLLNQGLEAGARNTDVVADALKEFQIRATDASELSAAGFARIGLNAEEMTAKIAAGGDGAREGLQQVLDGLRAIEDPVQRNAAAVELFGTKAEDLGEALFALDLTSAVDQLNGVQGAADRMFSTLADNDASRIQRAQRNIEVAADGIKGALASAFADPLGYLADFVSQNRGPVMQFFLDLANGALDFGETLVESAASGTEAFGAFVSGPLADIAEGLKSVIKFANPFADTTDLDAFIADMREFDETTQGVATVMRDELGGALDIARDKLNEFGEPAVAMGYLNDASLRLADSIAAVGYGADGAKLSLEGVDVANIRATESGSLLEGQVRNAIAALSDEISAASAAGESQETLAGRYRTATDALVGQLTQMGLTEDQARSLIDTVLQTPDSATTTFSSNAPTEKGKVQSLADRIVTLPDGSVVITADTSPGRSSVDRFIRDYAGKAFNVYVNAIGGAGSGGRGALQNARGNIVEFMALGGLPGVTPMAPLAQMVPPATWRVVGDRGDVPELYAPLDGSPRSWALIMEGLRRMPGSPDLSGAPVSAGPGSELPPIQIIHNGDNYATDPRDYSRAQREQLVRALDALR